MKSPLEDAFAQHYAGRHEPSDAFWWLDHPEQPSPSGTPPVQQLFLEAADDLEAQHHPAAAAALRETLADLLHADRRTALDALTQAKAHLQQPADDSYSG